MGAFEHAVLHPVEANPVWRPTLKDSFNLALASPRRQERLLYVTKRNYAWHEDAVIREVAEEIAHANIGLIMIVRDPRDSLTSRHANHGDTEFYLDTERWVRSVTAGVELFELLQDHARKIVIRYEDLVCDPVVTREAIEQRLSIRLDPQIEDWSRLKSNLQNIEVSDRLAVALHKVRDFDANSVGKWRHDPTCLEHWKEITSNTELMPAISDFMARHGYT